MTAEEMPKAEFHASGGMSGVQAKQVHGDINITGESVLPPPPLKVRRATPDERQQVQDCFVPPEGFAFAARRLSFKEPVLVLSGEGTGRHYTATRLLVDADVSDVVDLNRARALDTVREKDLTTGEGYIWDVSGAGDVAFTDWELRHISGLLRDTGCLLVVIVDDARQVPAAMASVITLTAPDAVEVAVATLRQRDGAVEDAIQVVEKLADLLGRGTPPSAAVWAATLATELPPDAARLALANGVEQVVADRYENLSTVSYAMLMTTAALENQPYDEVARHATELDVLIRTAELPEDKKLRPRRVFATRKDEILATIDAQVVLRDHPEYPGLTEETVRFVRPGSSEAVLRRLWVQYHVFQKIVLDWMGRTEMYKRFGDDCARALSQLITTVPAHAPLKITDELARAASPTKWYLAADTLAYIAGQADHRELVEKQLAGWIASGNARQRWTAAYLYGTRYSKANTLQALAQLERIARIGGARLLVRQGVAVSVIQLVARTEDRDKVLHRVLNWCHTYGKVSGGKYLREIGHFVALFVCGLAENLYNGPSDPVLVARQYPDIVRELAMLVLRDRDSGDMAIDRLEQLCRKIDLDALSTGRKAAARRVELVRLVGLVTPNFSWFARRKVVTMLARRHPGRTGTIRYIFRTANKVRRQLPADRTVPEEESGSGTVRAEAVRRRPVGALPVNRPRLPR
jgi:hypothetical protein